MNERICGSGDVFWTDKRVEMLKALAADKLTGGEIARAIGTTRSSVIGKMRRAGIPMQSGKYCNCNDRTRTPKPAHRAKSSVNGGGVVASIKARQANKRLSLAERVALAFGPREAHDLSPEPDIVPVPLRDLQNNQCRWPLGAPATEGFGFCGAQRFDQTVPYCLAHCRLAYRPVARRRAA